MAPRGLTGLAGTNVESDIHRCIVLFSDAHGYPGLIVDYSVAPDVIYFSTVAVIARTLQISICTARVTQTESNRRNAYSNFHPILLSNCIDTSPQFVYDAKN
jgi:hypothetical protein